MFSGLLQKMCLKESEVWCNLISNKIVNQGFWRLLSSTVLLRKFTYHRVPPAHRNSTQEAAFPARFCLCFGHSASLLRTLKAHLDILDAI